MADTIYKPALDETRFLKFYGVLAIGANLVLVPDTTVPRGARVPTLGEVVKEIVGVTFRAVPAAGEGDVVGIPGDIAIATANGAIAKGDRVYVTTTSGHLGQVKKFTGTKTDGAQFIVGIAQDDTSDGSLVQVRLHPHRVAEGKQYGKATLVAGTVTVAGVRVSTTCFIQVTSNTPGGTAGFLSAPSASRNSGAGTFVINSSSGADTCTADWEITDDD